MCLRKGLSTRVITHTVYPITSLEKTVTQGVRVEVFIDRAPQSFPTSKDLKLVREERYTEAAAICTVRLLVSRE